MEVQVPNILDNMTRQLIGTLFDYESKILKLRQLCTSLEGKVMQFEMCFVPDSQSELRRDPGPVSALKARTLLPHSSNVVLTNCPSF